MVMTPWFRTIIRNGRRTLQRLWLDPLDVGRSADQWRDA